MPFGDGTPVVDRGTAQWIGPDPDAFGADGVQVHDIGQVLDIGVAIVVTLGGGQSAGQGNPFDLRAAPAQDLVGAFGDHGGGVGVGRAAIRRVVLESAVPGRIV